MSKLLLVLFTGSESSLGSGFAAALGLSFDVLTLTGHAETNTGAEKELVAGLTSLPPADALASTIATLSQGYTHIAATSNMRSKDVMARVAGILDAGMVTDVTLIESPTRFKRPVLAGSIISIVEVLSTPVVLTFRPAGFAKGEAGGAPDQVSVSADASGKTVRISQSVRGGARPDLSQAKIVISGGRPLRDAETFERVIGGFADKVGGAVGATRAAVDSGIAPNELQVGQTGKIVAPDLYIAAGISGSTQHMAGIKDSKIIVAINKDPDAPIFESADYGLVADLFDALPAIERALGS